jgi:hypothetical protein
VILGYSLQKKKKLKSKYKQVKQWAWTYGHVAGLSDCLGLWFNLFFMEILFFSLNLFFCSIFESI